MKEISKRMLSHRRCNGNDCDRKCVCGASACECPGCSGARKARAK